MEEGMTNEEEIAEEVFKRSFIPRTLEDVRAHTHTHTQAINKVGHNVFRELN